MRRQLVIIGGSYAASETASAARSNGYEGKILILSDEAELPYHRPPLSKGFLLGLEQGGLPLKGGKFYVEQDVEISLNTRAISADSAESAIIMKDGRKVSFDTLVLAVGAGARRLEIAGGDLGGILYVRSIADARALKQETVIAENIVVIGGGFIGLEVASALVQQGKRITVVEASEHILNRVVVPPVSAFVAAAHRNHGVTIVTSRQVTELRGDGRKVRRAVLDDGSEIRSILCDGTARTFDAQLGSTVMEAAVRNNLPGIEAECGGACASPTCPSRSTALG